MVDAALARARARSLGANKEAAAPVFWTVGVDEIPTD